MKNNQAASRKHELATRQPMPASLFNEHLASDTLKRDKERAIFNHQALRTRRAKLDKQLETKRHKEELVDGIIRGFVMAAVVAILILLAMSFPWR